MSRRSKSRHIVSHRIAEFICQTALSVIPQSVRATAKLHILDGLANILGGANEPSARLLRRHYRHHRGNTAVSVLGTNTRFAVEHAALLNGVQGHVLDYDDAQLTSLPSRPMGQQTHPTAPVLAAALALAESRSLSGADLLAAYIVGVEVACRLGDAIDPIHYLNGFHPTGTLGAFGAAAASVHLLKPKPVAIRHALGIAGTLCSGLRANRGTMAKGLNAGRAAENGVLAAMLAAQGFTASENIFDDPMGFFAAACGNRVDAKLLRFGKPFFFAQPGVAIKLYPCAGVLHPALDILVKLRTCHLLKPGAIRSVNVTLDADAARPLVYDRPRDGLQSKFSLPFAAAVALVDGAAGLKQFTDARVRNPEIQKLMKRVKLLRHGATEGARTSASDTSVEIALNDGEVLQARDSIARGHPLRPVGQADVEEKFCQCAEAVLPAQRIDHFVKNFWELERETSIASWLSMLRPPRR
jgi:2-methylcitrate dehydratase PrpD